MVEMKELAKPFVLAVDGPAGSGKSSVCARIGKMRGWSHINTGQIYRAVGFLIDNESTIDAIIAAAEHVAKDLTWSSNMEELWLDGKNITQFLTGLEVGKLASQVAAIPEVREVLLPIQRKLIASAPNGAVVDGRDIGTTIYPEANLKLYLTASLEERARRRLNQIKSNASQSVDLSSIMQQIAQRDNQDQKRKTAPLTKAKGALVVDTSELDEGATISLIMQLIEERMKS